MGGSIYMGNVTQTAEYNIFSDPESAKAVFECGHPKIVLIPLEVTQKTATT